jgi:four helix bundle protein
MVTAKRRMDSFTKLVAWQTSHKLVLATLKTCGNLKAYDPLRGQIERAAISITSNIAEGFGRQSAADKKHFYIISCGSVYELQNQLLLLRELQKISKEDFNGLAELSLDSIRLIHGLIRSTSKTKNND